MKKHTIKLTAQEKHTLKHITRRGEHKARVIKRAQILLASGKGRKDADIAVHVGVTARTVENIRKRYAVWGFNRALYDAARPGAARKLTGKAEARLIALACSDPPDGHTHWTLALMRRELINEGIVKNISTVTLWNCLDEKGIKPWREKNVVYPQADGGVHRTPGRHPGFVSEVI